MPADRRKTAATSICAFLQNAVHELEPSRTTRGEHTYCPFTCNHDQRLYCDPPRTSFCLSWALSLIPHILLVLLIRLLLALIS